MGNERGSVCVYQFRVPKKNAHMVHEVQLSQVWENAVDFGAVSSLCWSPSDK